MIDDASRDESDASPGRKAAEDRRLYVLDGEWSVAVNDGAASMYCFHRNAGEEYFHLIVDGEIHLINGAERVCLNCAIRQGLITHDRLFWQHRPRSRRSRI